MSQSCALDPPPPGRYECPNDDPANRPNVKSGVHCYYWLSGEPGGISGYSNKPDCSDATAGNPGGPAVPPGKYWRYQNCWYPADSSCTTNNDQLQFTCALKDTEYPGDADSLVSCCLGETDPGKCRPGYCANSAKCATLLGSLCAGGQFAAGRDGACLSWCAARPGQCDAGAEDYCRRTGGGATPQGRDFCACISAPEAQIPGAQGIPPCFDAACVAKGYKTQAMLDVSEHCPEYCQAAINCYQGEGSSCNISGTTFSSVCGQNLPGAGGQWAPVGPPAAPMAPVGPPRPALLKALLAVGLLLLLIAAAVWLARGIAARAPKTGGIALPAGLAPLGSAL